MLSRFHCCSVLPPFLTFGSISLEMIPGLSGFQDWTRISPEGKCTGRNVSSFPHCHLWGGRSLVIFPVWPVFWVIPLSHWVGASPKLPRESFAGCLELNKGCKMTKKILTICFEVIDDAKIRQGRSLLAKKFYQGLRFCCFQENVKKRDALPRGHEWYHLRDRWLSSQQGKASSRMWESNLTLEQEVGLEMSCLCCCPAWARLCLWSFTHCASSGEGEVREAFLF